MWGRHRPQQSLLLRALAGTLVFLHIAIRLSVSLDPYKTLGVTKSSTEDEIKRAYRKQALKFHPDKNPKGKERFVQIQEAYDILTDPEKRRQHDMGGAYQQHQYQHQRHHHHQQQWGNQHHWHEPDPDSVLPSETTTLTSSNFQHHVFETQKPWLFMVFSEHSLECRAASPVWEALWKHVLSSSGGGGGGEESSMVRMGRVHWRTQRHLVYWLNKGMGGWDPIGNEGLPVVIGVPNSCRGWTCMKRYYGPISLPALQDFVAEAVLQLPPVPSVNLVNLDILFGNVKPFKTLALAFGKSEGQGSLPLRMLAKKHSALMQVVRVAYKEADAAAWQARLQIHSLPRPPFLVFFRGPGLPPEVLPIGKGAGSELGKEVESKGLYWQVLPALRQATAAPLGCTLGATPGPEGLANLCIVAISPQRGLAQDQGRINTLRLLRHIWAQNGAGGGATAISPAMAVASQAIGIGKLRIVWLDAATQQAFCRFHFGSSSDSAGGACGLPWWRSLSDRLLRRPLRRSPMYLIAFKPVGPGRSSRRAPDYHSAVLGSIDLSETEMPESRILEAAEWASECYAAAMTPRSEDDAGRGKGPLRVLRGRLPPPFEDDEVPGIPEMALASLTSALRWLRSSSGLMAGSGLSESVLQLISTGVCLAVLGLLHVIWYQFAHPEQARQHQSRAPRDPQQATSPPPRSPSAEGVIRGDRVGATSPTSREGSHD